MWIWMSLGSALLLGLYDVAKKQALKRNSVLWILFVSTALTTLFLSPFLAGGTPQDHLKLVFKAFLVTTSWVSGLMGVKLLPLTTASTIKASRPVFVVVFSLILFGERLNLLQWSGILLVLLALYLLSQSSRKEGVSFKGNRGVVYMAVAVLSGAASALYDKYIIKGMEPMFVQSWGNFYITVLLALIIFVAWLRDRGGFQRLRWDWTLVAIAVLITAADALYFYSLKQPDALLSVVSMVRRCSVIVTFALGALLFKEHNIRDKAKDLAILLIGMALLVFGSA